MNVYADYSSKKKEKVVIAGKPPQLKFNRPRQTFSSLKRSTASRIFECDSVIEQFEYALVSLLFRDANFTFSSQQCVVTWILLTLSRMRKPILSFCCVWSPSSTTTTRETAETTFFSFLFAQPAKTYDSIYIYGHLALSFTLLRCFFMFDQTQSKHERTNNESRKCKFA